MATDTPSTELDRRLTELDASLRQAYQLAAELPGLPDQVREVFRRGDGAFITGDDSYRLLAQAMRAYPDTMEAMALQVSDLAVEMDRATSITRAIRGIGASPSAREEAGRP